MRESGGRGLAGGSREVWYTRRELDYKHARELPPARPIRARGHHHAQPLGPASDPLDRRELLRVGGLALGGLSLPHLLGRPRRPPARRPKSFGKAKNCIILYLSGGPAQLDTFDPKPDAPDDIRGEFKTIQTTLPGVRFSELLPHAAKWMHKAALVRTMCHDAQRPRPRLVLDVHRLPVPRRRSAT